MILGGDLNIISPFKEFAPTFIALSISFGEQQKQLAQKAQGKSVVHIHNSDIQELTILYPKLAEQQKIGDFFKALDKSITLHQRKSKTNKSL